ncbi:MAG: glycosyltransferase family 4 protein [Bacteroidetes bacterium]|nr:glycosyltransferase family 4 protein [Bacteroidota bacterium]MBS1628737.1 glycosyltransferase family 4 protein [Bacteroidota bacterium]
MHNLTKIRVFRLLLKISWLPSLLLVYPFARWRKRCAAEHVFFFDRYSMGGAQRVHIDILESISEHPKQVFFTRKSPDNGMKAAFEAIPNCSLLDIHFWCDNLLFRLFAVHYWAFFLNRQHNLKILSANSTFFYDLLPWLRSDFQRIELLHNFTYGKKGMEFFGLANHTFLDHRIVVDFFTATNIRNQYAEAGVPVSFGERIRVIEPGVLLPALLPEKPFPPLQVLYAGRGGAQKRVWLIDRIAASCYEQGLPVQFHFAGNVEEDLTFSVKKMSVMHGRINDPVAMQALYASCHLIILTSSYEGFPMFIKEGMAQGCIPVVTALPGNKTHLTHQQNALLIEPVDDEQAVVAQGEAFIQMLFSDLDLRRSLSVAAFDYAQTHFSKSAFTDAYRHLLLRAN